jgi:hypothetical protein
MSLLPSTAEDEGDVEENHTKKLTAGTLDVATSKMKELDIDYDDDKEYADMTEGLLALMGEYRTHNIFAEEEDEQIVAPLVQAVQQATQGLALASTVPLRRNPLVQAFALKRVGTTRDPSNDDVPEPSSVPSVPEKTGSVLMRGSRGSVVMPGRPEKMGSMLIRGNRGSVFAQPSSAGPEKRGSVLVQKGNKLPGGGWQRAAKALNLTKVSVHSCALFILVINLFSLRCLILSIFFPICASASASPAASASLPYPASPNSPGRQTINNLLPARQPC